jgi:hypothetical protein
LVIGLLLALVGCVVVAPAYGPGPHDHHGYDRYDG